jgi:hypothetical protein
MVPFISTIERNWWPQYFLFWNIVAQELSAESVMYFRMPFNNIAGLLTTRTGERPHVQQQATYWRPHSSLEEVAINYILWSSNKCCQTWYYVQGLHCHGAWVGCLPYRFVGTGVLSKLFACSVTKASPLSWSTIKPRLSADYNEANWLYFEKISLKTIFNIYGPEQLCGIILSMVE